VPDKTSLTAIHKTLTVARPAEAAFRVFMDIGSWWPRTHSYGEGRAKDILLEGRVGGRLYERYTDGEEFVIGRVTAYDPPRRVVFTWKGPDMEQPTEVEVTFHAEGTRTRVELVHGGWDRVGTKVTHGMADFNRGWDPVMQAYAAHLDKSR
jgi:uncharacterized protein YndB with AHSA1/START domain